MFQCLRRLSRGRSERSGVQEHTAGFTTDLRQSRLRRRSQATLLLCAPSGNHDVVAGKGVIRRRASAIPHDRFGPEESPAEVAFSAIAGVRLSRSHDRIHVFAGVELACASAT
jgi:hypothetical protein